VLSAETWEQTFNARSKKKTPLNRSSFARKVPFYCASAHGRPQERSTARKIMSKKNSN